MGKNYFSNFGFLSKLYLKLNERQLISLDSKIKELQRQIEAKRNLLEQNKHFLNRLDQENALLKKQYEYFIKLFQSENKTFTISNNNYIISTWENVFIKKRINHYVIQTKREQNIYDFDENMNDFFDYLITLSYSLLVISADSYRIILQLRV